MWASPLSNNTLGIWSTLPIVRLPTLFLLNDGIFILKFVETTVEQERAINRTVDWLLMSAAFDFISTESGLSEFTHPNCTLMLVPSLTPSSQRGREMYPKVSVFRVGVDEYGHGKNTQLSYEADIY
jgi:hypothetical protein